MQSGLLAQSTLVLVAHGSTANDGSGAAVELQAAALRERHIFADVQAAFWKQPPFLADVVPQAATSLVIVVPFFISAGFFSETVIPQALGLSMDGSPTGRIRRQAARVLCYGQPVGTHDRMTEVVLARAEEVVRRHPFPGVPPASTLSLFIAGHGTARDPQSRQSAERQATLIRKQAIYAHVQAVFMEEKPRIADVMTLAPTRAVVVVPFFMSDGLHVVEDVPVLLGESPSTVAERRRAGQPAWRNPTERNGRVIWYGRAVGTEPSLLEVILDRAREAASAVPSI